LLVVRWRFDHAPPADGKVHIFVDEAAPHESMQLAMLDGEGILSKGSDGQVLDQLAAFEAQLAFDGVLRGPPVAGDYATMQATPTGELRLLYDRDEQRYREGSQSWAVTVAYTDPRDAWAVPVDVSATAG